MDGRDKHRPLQQIRAMNPTGAGRLVTTFHEIHAGFARAGIDEAGLTGLPVTTIFPSVSVPPALSLLHEPLPADARAEYISIRNSPALIMICCQ
jgi:hypothetical protein